MDKTLYQEQHPEPFPAVHPLSAARTARGRLTIFLGMAPGVGKTTAMLQAARRWLANGVDVVIGHVDTHGRAEVHRLLENLSIIPSLRVGYQGEVLKEMDLEGLLERRPQLVLVDDLAASNPAGIRHNRRYQDVLELLDAGIDVFTTLNLQNLESRADAAEKITGLQAGETVPDTILERADEFELIDVTPAELLRRLAEGKVHIPPGKEDEGRRFYREGNLIALREMVLRLTAERVDQQLREHMVANRIPGPLKAGVRLMVALSSSPLSQRLVRWACRMANNLKGSWLAVYVRSPYPLPETEEEQLAANMALARELGAEVITTADEDVVRGVLRVAQQQNVSQIVVGKPARGAFREWWWGNSPVNRLLREGGDVDIYVVSETQTGKNSSLISPRFTTRAVSSQYLGAGGVILAVTVVNLLISPYVNDWAIALIYLLAVSIMSLFTTLGPGFAAAALSALLWNFLFIQPRYTFAGKVEDVLMLGMYFVIALITGNLNARIRYQEKVNQRREERTLALYALSREVASATTVDAVLRTAVKQIDQVFGTEVSFLLAETADGLARYPHPASTLAMAAQEFGVATWAFEHQKPAGRFTQTMPMAEGQYLPLVAPGGVVGVMGIRLRRDQQLSVDQQLLLETFASQIAVAVERELLNEAAKRTQVLEQSECLYKTLFNSISHEFRTPITEISGAASNLLDPAIADNPSARSELVRMIQEAAERLHQLVKNLLDMARLESGLLRPHLEWCDISDLISVVMGRMERECAHHPVTVDIEPDLPLVRVDFVLMEHVLTNLLRNAVTHTSPGTPICITVRTEGGDLVIAVADKGPSLKPEVLLHIFDKFYRAAGAPLGGMGLGLAISRGLVEAHRGTIKVENAPDGGTRFLVRLSIDPAPMTPVEILP